jgi:nicotinamidase-related amidase
MRHDDRGSVSLAMMGMFMAMFLAVGLVFDGGAVLATRRQVITAAESAARLGAATADPFSGSLERTRVESVTRDYIARIDGLRVRAVVITGLRIEVTVEATAHEVFFPAVGVARTTVVETGSAEVRL